MRQSKPKTKIMQIPKTHNKAFEERLTISSASAERLCKARLVQQNPFKINTRNINCYYVHHITLFVFIEMCIETRTVSKPTTIYVFETL